MATKIDAIDEQTIEALAHDLVRLTAEDGQEVIIPSWEEVVASASHFLTSLSTLAALRESQEITTLRTIMQGDPENASANFLLRGKNELAYIRSQYLLAFDFDKKLTAYRGHLPRKALMTWKYTDDQGQTVIQTQEYSLLDLAKKITADKRIIQSSFKLQDESDSKEAQLRKQNVEMEEHIRQTQAAYLGASNRLDVFYQRRNAVLGSTYQKYVPKTDSYKTVKRQKQGGLLMWIENSEWMVEQVSNGGDLSEAYAAALLKECRTEAVNKCDLCLVPAGSPPFQSHELISTFAHQYIFNVTNMAEIREADIAHAKDYQYDIKSGKAQAPSLQQYIDMATYIESNPNLTLEELEAGIKELFPQDTHRNAIYKMNEALGESIDTILDQTAAIIQKG